MPHARPVGGHRERIALGWMKVLELGFRACSAQRKVSEGKPGRAERGDRSAVEIVADLGEVGDQQLDVGIGGQLGDVAKLHHDGLVARRIASSMAKSLSAVTTTNPSSAARSKISSSVARCRSSSATWVASKSAAHRP
jgi:hypothetical protein